MKKRLLVLFMTALGSFGLAAGSAAPASAAEYCYVSGPIDYNGHVIWPGYVACVPGP